MLNQDDFRRRRFCTGQGIRMADGQTWFLPDPTSSGLAGPEYDSLLTAWDEAENEGDRRRAELALVIFLLDYNYRLDAAGFSAILDCLSNGDTLDRIQGDIRTAVTSYVAKRRDNAPSGVRGDAWSGRRRAGMAHPVS